MSGCLDVCHMSFWILVCLSGCLCVWISGCLCVLISGCVYLDFHLSGLRYVWMSFFISVLMCGCICGCLGVHMYDVCMSICLDLSVFISVSCLDVHPSGFLSVSVDICLDVRMFYVWLYRCMCVCIDVWMSVCLSGCLGVWMS